MRSYKSCSYLLCSGALSVGLMVGPAAINHANAAQIIVSGGCTLPKAIANTNANSTVFSACKPEKGAKAYRVNGFDRIFIEKEALQLVDDMQTITGDLVIEGRPSNNPTTTINGSGGAQRLFWVNPGVRVEFRVLTLQNGYANGGNGRGGCIYNDGGHVTLLDSVVRKCQSDGDGGAIYNKDGELDIQRTVLKNNTAGDDGGAIANREGGIVNIRMNSECFDNEADVGSSDANGGCVDSRNTDSYVHIRQTVCRANEAGGDGGCLYSQSPAVARLSYPGGTEVIGNEAIGIGGGVGTDDAATVEITGDGSFINANTPDNCNVAIIATSGAVCD
jgi:hypothetical protein